MDKLGPKDILLVINTTNIIICGFLWIILDMNIVLGKKSDKLKSIISI